MHPTELYKLRTCCSRFVTIVILVSVTVLTSPLDDGARENDESRAWQALASEGRSRATLTSYYSANFLALHRSTRFNVQRLRCTNFGLGRYETTDTNQTKPNAQTPLVALSPPSSPSSSSLRTIAFWVLTSDHISPYIRLQEIISGVSWTRHLNQNASYISSDCGSCVAGAAHPGAGREP